MAPGSTVEGHQAEIHGWDGWPQIRLDAARHWAGGGGSPWSWEHRRAKLRGAGLSGGFLKIALHDFIKEFGGDRGEGIVNFLSHVDPLRSFSSGKFFSLFSM